MEMMVEDGFDQWRKDVFFSAAEEIQESADKMESIYRTWMREGKNEFSLGHTYELRSELQTALGITKWQLEEFEKAAKLAHGRCYSDRTVARHMQFIVAIESQIRHIENSLKNSLAEEGREPFRWVKLDKEELDDLALFLSGHETTKTTRLPLIHENMNNKGNRINSHCKRSNSANVGSWKVDIPDEEDNTEENATHTDFSYVSRSVRSTTESKWLRWLRNSFRMTRGKDKGIPNHPNPVVNNRQYSLIGGLQRQPQGINRSLRISFILMITIFLMVPFVIYET